MRVRLALPRPTAAELRGLLCVLVGANMRIMAHHRLPSLYSGAIRYRRERPDVWLTADAVARRGAGDCEDLSAYRVSELRLAGEDASPWVYEVRRGKWHAVVKRGDGSMEDPSRRLGMKGRQ